MSHEMTEEEREAVMEEGRRWMRISLECGMAVFDELARLVQTLPENDPAIQGIEFSNTDLQTIFRTKDTILSDEQAAELHTELQRILFLENGLHSCACWSFSHRIQHVLFFEEGSMTRH